MQILACPDHSCQAPAEIVDRWVFPSTSGPVEHVQTRCLNGHVFTPTTDSLVARARAEARQAPAAGA